jgi:hypothetical protein
MTQESTAPEMSPVTESGLGGLTNEQADELLGVIMTKLVEFFPGTTEDDNNFVVVGQNTAVVTHRHEDGTECQGEDFMFSNMPRTDVLVALKDITDELEEQIANDGLGRLLDAIKGVANGDVSGASAAVVLGVNLGETEADTYEEGRDEVTARVQAAFDAAGVEVRLHVPDGERNLHVELVHPDQDSGKAFSILQSIQQGDDHGTPDDTGTGQYL